MAKRYAPSYCHAADRRGPDLVRSIQQPCACKAVDPRLHGREPLSIFRQRSVFLKCGRSGCRVATVGLDACHDHRTIGPGQLRVGVRVAGQPPRRQPRDWASGRGVADRALGLARPVRAAALADKVDTLYYPVCAAGDEPVRRAGFRCDSAVGLVRLGQHRAGGHSRPP